MAGSQDDKVAGESKETTSESSNEPAPAAVNAASAAPEAKPDEAAASTEAAAPASAPANESDEEETDEQEGEDEDEDGEEEDGEEEADEQEVEAAPPPPRADEPAPLFDQHPWAVTVRVLAISALLGLALSGWAQLSIKSAWVPEFLSANVRG